MRWSCWATRQPCCVLLVCALLVVSSHGSEFAAPSRADVNPAGIRGSLVICGGGDLPEAAIGQFRDLGGGDEASLVVIPTASERADRAEPDSFKKAWLDRGFARVEVVHTRDRTRADADDFLAPLKAATAVWFVGGQQSRLAEAYVGTRVEDELYALLERGGVIGGTSAGAAIQSRLMIASGNPQAKLMQGLDLLPGSVIDQHFKVRDRQPRLVQVLAQYPGYFGLGIDEDTSLIVRGRTMRVVGDSTVTVCLSESANRPAVSYEIEAGKTADLTALRRAAIARSEAPFPAKTQAIPRVNNGALMIVGGGRASEAMWRRFVELAGGPEAQIVIVPTAVPNPRLDADRDDARQLLAVGAKSVTVLHSDDRAEADTPEFVAALAQATGVWFGGGRQWRIVDAYEGTATYEAFHDVLRRGGVIGGSSAGATIQGEYLVRGNPLGNQDMMAEGYERGFAFLPGCAIDQHFTQRRRQPDMQALKQAFPQLLGIGIDESTELIVQDTTAHVFGKGSVYFYDANLEQDSDRADYTMVQAGEAYDLARRIRIE